MDIINRTIYLNHIISQLDRGIIIILTGQRRVGKSFMLKQLHSWILGNIPDANVLYINKELFAFKDISTADDLYLRACASLPEGAHNYLLIDEVQDILCYENALRSLLAENRCQIVATGSNAYIFSSELSTRLSGRYVEIPVNSLTYTEFLSFHNLSDSDSALALYLRAGGLPGLCHYDISDEAQIRDYLQGVYNTILLRDVISRCEIRNVQFMENLVAFIADNIGKMISVRNIANTMKSQGVKITEYLTSSYLRNLCDAFIIAPTSRYNIHGKQLLEQNYKYYFGDHGLRNLICGFNIRSSIEKVIENVIRLHLLSQGFNVTVGILRNGEIDFVATRGSKRIYVQAVYLLASEDTILREFGNLKKICDNYPKYVVSMDPISGELSQYPGIFHLHLREFLLTEF